MPTAKGFVYALVEREFVKTCEPVVKVGMSSKSNPADRLRGYPKGSFFIWVRHTPTPRQDEQLILATMRIWFKSRRDLGAEYFEGDQNVVTGLLSAMMQARESMRSGETEEEAEKEAEEEEAEKEAMEKVKRKEKEDPLDALSLFNAFSADSVAALNGTAIPCEKLHGMFADYCSTRHPAARKPRVGYGWIEKQCRDRLGATTRFRIHPATQQPCPMIVFPVMVLAKESATPVPHPLLQRLQSFRCGP